MCYKRLLILFWWIGTSALTCYTSMLESCLNRQLAGQHSGRESSPRKTYSCISCHITCNILIMFMFTKKETQIH